MKFDSNAAWKWASAQISANRTVLLPLVGVFFLLPSLIVGLFFPQPEAATGMDSEAMVKVMGEYYAATLPVMIPMTVVQMIGTLAVLAIFTDARRPTVGEAIGLGARSIVPYVLAQIVFGVAIGLGGGVLLLLASASGSPLLSGAAVLFLIGVVIWALVRTSLVAPVITVEGERNPIAALRRSWRLTAGHTARIVLFYALVALAFLIVMIVATGLLGVIFALIAGPEGSRVAGTVLSSAIGSIMALYFVAIIAAVHRQLAGASPDAAAATFD